MGNQPPVTTFKDGFLQVAIWERSCDNGTFYTVDITRSYKDGDDWKKTHSLNKDDLLKVSRLTERAYDAIVDLQARSRASAAPAANQG